MSGRFEIDTTPLEGLFIARRLPIGDERGFFERFYCQEELQVAGMEKSVRQINRTLTENKGTLRGLHFQKPPHAERKMVSCLQGRIFDVAVDLRAGSPTFGQWHGVELSGANHKSLIIPEGFAHGFQTLEENCELLYLHSEFYHPESEGGLNVFDPELGINWPLPAAQLSQRDSNFTHMSKDFTGLKL